MAVLCKATGDDDDAARSDAMNGVRAALPAAMDRICRLQRLSLTRFLADAIPEQSCLGSPEYALALSRSSRPSAGVFVQTPTTSASAASDLAATVAESFDWYRQSTGASLHIDAAIRLVQLVYPRRRMMPLRFGLGLASDSEQAFLKLYLDLHALGVSGAAALAEMCLEVLGLPSLPAAHPDPRATGRILGVDFLPDQVRAKFYRPARRVGAEDILARASILSRRAGSHLRDVLQILDSPSSPLEESSTLWVDDCHLDPFRTPDIKLDFQFADFVGSDRAASHLVRSVLKLAGIDHGPYAEVCGAALAGVSPNHSKGVHQYLGIGIDQAGLRRCVTYFRPLHSGPNGLPRRARPRVLTGRKESDSPNGSAKASVSSATRPDRRTSQTGTSPVRRVLDPCSEAIQRGVEALASRLENDLWQDFECSIGESDEWASAFVLARLRSVAEARELHAAVAPALAARQRTDGGWGYNQRVASDCDSTAWAVQALGRERLGLPALQSAVQLILKHQVEGAGFATYQACYKPCNRDLRRDWFEPQSCVTSAAVIALHNSGQATNARIDGALQFLAGNPESSCWWLCKTYCRALSSEAFSTCGATRALQAARPNTASSTIDLHRTAPTAFGLAHAILLTMYRGRTLDETLVTALLRLQRPDGSWPPATILNVPDDTPGRTLRSADGRGTFATAASLHALSQVRLAAAWT